MTGDSHADDLVVFAADGRDAEDTTDEALPGWKVLVVDDEPDVHVATRLALDDVEVNGRRLSFLNAHSAAEARDVLARHDDIAVVLLDVVMETDRAGLDLVHFMRRVLGRAETRIILRTGQPGLAPEIDAIRDCDINDYKSKGELTRTRLFSSVTVAIRSYDQIRAITASRRGLGQVVAATAALMARRDLPAFADEVLAQLAALLRVPDTGIVMACDGAEPPRPAVAIARGYPDILPGWTLDRLPASPGRDLIDQACTGRCNVRGAGGQAFFVPGQNGKMVVLLPPSTNNDVEQDLAEAFCANAGIAYDNVILYGRLRNLAFVDPLTGLPNRQGFVAVIDARIAAAPDREGRVALIDLNGFGEVNNVLGHDQGDELLRAVAARLGQGLPEGTTIARLGADTFGLLGDEAAMTPEAIHALFVEPLPLHGASRPMSVTVGLADIGQVSGDGRTLLRKTDVALRRAKQENARSMWYRSEDATELGVRLRLLDELRAALAAGDINVAYQPQIRLADGRIVGFEALARWRTADGRDIPPATFVPLAEQSGLIVELGRLVLRRALGDLARLRRTMGAELTMAVNMSMLEFQDSDTLGHIQQALEAAGLPGSALEVELTESLAAQDPAALAVRLKSFRDEGIQIAIDDFGTGFSSLGRLASLPLDRLKIDRSFLADVEHPSSQRTIVAVMVELAHAFGLDVVAEGVETPGQLDALARLGCSLAQGYHVGRPMSFDRLTEWLDRRSRVPAPAGLLGQPNLH